jgi:ubiquinone/menaquinone biosynthesis C-methylase UbiE
MDSDRRIWLDTEESEEARAFFGNPYMILSLGDHLLPEAIPLDREYSVLDIGCGAGEWAFGVIQQYPLARVHGIDTSDALVGKAVRRVHREGLERVSFQLFDAAQPLTFFDETFDIVHVQSLASFIMTAMRDRIIDEMLRVLKVGGWLNIIDFEQGSTSSPAYNRLSIMGLAGVGSLGGTLIPSSSNYGVAARLYGFLVEAGLIDVSYTVHAVDYGVNSHPQTRQFLNDLVVGMRNFKPFLLMLEITSNQTFDDLVEQAIAELYRPDSCGYAYLISALGRKDF